MPHKSVLYFRKLAVEAARLADQKKGEDIRLLKMKPRTSVADYFLFVTADSTPQLEALDEHLSRLFKSHGIFPIHHEGLRSRTWKVLDYGGVLLHLMQRTAREFYALERLYPNARPVCWNPKNRKKSAARKPKKTD